MTIFLVTTDTRRSEVSRTLSVAQAKATFAACVRWAEDGEAIIISRHGKPVAALVQAEDVERLQRLRAAGPEGGLASLAGGWAGSDELARLVRRASRVRG
jgi:prevent-host-death family protein